MLTDKRISSLDIFRGMIMILMALDHTRDFFHVDAFKFMAEDLTQTTPGLFLTRWITHFCAPGFAFLAGISAFLYGSKTNSKKELASYLITRGLILVLLELTVVRFGWRFEIDYSSISGLVIWALGWGMVFLAALIYLPKYILAALSISILLFHNLLDLVPVPENKILEFILTFFHRSADVNIHDSFGIFILYPVLPIIGLMGLGYTLGEWYKTGADANKRQGDLIISGSVMIVLFIIVRLINHYGDPSPWTDQKNPLFTILSFINVTKYPMSLDYVLMTIGPSLLLLAFIEKVRTSVLSPVAVIGRVSLVFYIIHIYLIHFLALCLATITHPEKMHDIWGGKWNKLAQYGQSLPVVYLIWIGIVTILYYICIRYGAFKRKSPLKWLRYF
jgi:uncharacterized membrane protein